MGIEYYVYHIYRHQNIDKNDSLFLQNYHVIKTYFENFEGKFNNYFFDDLKKKIDNMLYYTILKLNPPKNTPYQQNKLFDLLNKKKEKTPEEIIKANFSIELDLKDLYKNEVIDYQAIDLLRTLGTQWYKCPNGHLYTVGECGRPMEEARCPECGQKIGGQNHIPAQNNNQINLVQNQMMNLNLNNNIINNEILNQDQEALNNMNNEHIANQEHHMDDDIRELLQQHPEMNDYN